MIELNLLPDVKREFVQAQRTRRKMIALMILISIIAAGLVVALAIYVYGVQLARNAILDGNIENNATTLSEIEDIDNYLTIQNQLSVLPELHEEKHEFDRLLDFLPMLNPAPPNNIRISQLSVDAAEGTISLNAQARDYQAVTVFENTLENAELVFERNDTDAEERALFAETIEMSEVGLGEDASGNRIVTFTATVYYNPETFSRSISSVRLAIPERTTTQSAQGVPQVFGRGAPGEDE